MQVYKILGLVHESNFDYDSASVAFCKYLKFALYLRDVESELEVGLQSYSLLKLVGI
jgi:hypothetical protein